jgi:tRNA(His) 5'-end guanylyltransferase
MRAGQRAYCITLFVTNNRFRGQPVCAAVTLLTCIQKTPGSNLYRDIGYNVWDLSRYFSVRSHQCHNNALKKATTAPFQILASIPQERKQETTFQLRGGNTSKQQLHEFEDGLTRSRPPALQKPRTWKVQSSSAK